MLNVEAESKVEVPQRSMRSTAFTICLTAACFVVGGLGVLALVRSYCIRDGRDVVQRLFYGSSYHGAHNVPSGLRGGQDVLQSHLKETSEDVKGTPGVHGSEDAVLRSSEETFRDGDHSASERQLGRRRRRRRKSAPAPAPAPDYSAIHYPKYIRLSSGWCEDFGYEQITTYDTCNEAGTYISGDSSQAIYSAGTSGQERPGGCASYGTTLNPLDLHYYPTHAAQCGTNDYHCICQLRPTFSSDPVATRPVPYMVVRENKCETFGYKTITSLDACTAAARWLSRSHSPVAREDSSTGDSRPEGCAFHSADSKAYTSQSAAIYFAQGSPRWKAGDCGVLNFDCICEHSSV